MRTQQHVAGVQRPLQEELLGLGQVDATQWGLGEGVGGHQGQAVDAHLVDPVDGLSKDVDALRTRRLPGTARITAFDFIPQDHWIFVTFHFIIHYLEFF